jgi:hypothetical protein
MSTTNPLPDELSELGEALHAAVAADQRRTAQGRARAPRSPASAGRDRREVGRLRAFTRSRRRLAIAVAAVVVAVPGAALGANALLSTGQVATGLSHGTLALLGTHPRCTTVRAGVAYHCALSSAPTAQGGPAAGGWLRTVEPSVGPDHRIDGGCRALNADGTEWACYLGEAAVRQRIIGPDFLGQRSYGPGVG